MKAIVQDRYGSPAVLRWAEADTPVVTGDQVLVRVRAASVNARDWHVMSPVPPLLATRRTTAALPQLRPAVEDRHLA